VLVDLRPRVPGPFGGEQFLVVDEPGQPGAVAVAVHDEMAEGLEFIPAGRQHRSEDRRQAGVGEQHGVLGMADDVSDLLRRQPDVDGVHHRTHARNGEVRLLMLLVIPAKGGDPVAPLDAQAAQAGRQLIRAVGQGPELDAARPVGLAGDDLAVGVQGPAVLEDVPDRERKVHHRGAHG
jgi:hypothetical protein